MNNLSYFNVSLRPFVLGDAQTHLENEDIEQIKWVSGGKSTLESVQNWIKKNQKYWKENAPVFTLAIEDSQTHKLLGFIEANTDYENLEQIKEGEVNISYGLYPNARGKGVATEAVKLMLEYLKDKGYSQAVIAINPENSNSLKVPAKLGFIEISKITTKENKQLVIFSKSI